MQRFVNTILNGDSLNMLKKLPDGCVDMTMTSPPYWALRDYGVTGQIGLENTFDNYIHRLCDVFDEVWRVTKQSGTCWVNLGDTYRNPNTHTKENTSPPRESLSVPNKCLVMIPFRFTLEMVNRGWILRNTIIWHKPNAMPSSAKDRFTVDFEYLFFFSKSKTYFFNQDAVRVPHGKDQRLAGIRRAREYGYDGKGSYQDWYFNKREGNDWVNKKETKDTLTFGQAKCQSKTTPPNLIHPRGRNRRCVWDLPTRPYQGAHFAVYPETLCHVPIQAGCPQDGVVLDPFAGSGTTLKVAQELGRSYIGIELNPNYIELAKQRLNNSQHAQKHKSTCVSATSHKKRMHTLSTSSQPQKTRTSSCKTSCNVSCKSKRPNKSSKPVQTSS